VVGEARDGTEAILLAKQLRPDVVLMDGELREIEATFESLRDETRIVILTMRDDERSVVDAIRSGARAIVLKRSSDIDLLDALNTVAKGGWYLSPAISDKLLMRIKRGGLEQNPAADLKREIAILLDLTRQMVRGYTKKVMKKLKALLRKLRF